MPKDKDEPLLTLKEFLVSANLQNNRALFYTLKARYQGVSKTLTEWRKIVPLEKEIK